MSLKDEFWNLINQHNYLDELVDEMGLTEVKSESVDQRRWFVIYRNVYTRNGEYLVVEHQVPATEMQENDSLVESIIDVYNAEPVETTVTVYQRI